VELGCFCPVGSIPLAAGTEITFKGFAWDTEGVERDSAAAFCLMDEVGTAYSFLHFIAINRLPLAFLRHGQTSWTDRR